MQKKLSTATDDFEVKRIFQSSCALVVSQYGAMACSIWFSCMLTRFLHPHDYGLVAVALFQLTCFNWVLEWGWDQGFAAHPDIPVASAAGTHRMIRMVLGAVPFIFCCIAIPLLMRYISIRAIIVLLLCAIIYWIERAGLTYKILLERRYKLRSMALTEFMATCLSYGTAFCAAYTGWGVYALVVQRGVEKTFLTLWYIGLSPWDGVGVADMQTVRLYMRSFGLATWVGSIVSLCIYDAMPFIIRCMSTTHQAGLYAKAFTMATFPLMLTGIASRMTTPLYIKYQYNVAACRRVFIIAQTIKLLLLVPAQAVLALFAPFWIPVLLGAQWKPLVDLYRCMCIYGLFRAFFDDVPNVLTYGFKKPWELTKNQSMQALLLMSIGLPLVYYYQAFGAAIAASGVMVYATVAYWRVVWQQLACHRVIWMGMVRQVWEKGKIVVGRYPWY